MAKRTHALCKQVSRPTTAGWQRISSLKLPFVWDSTRVAPSESDLLTALEAEGGQEPVTPGNWCPQPLPMGSSLGRPWWGQGGGGAGTQHTHIDCEVLGGAGDVARGRQRLWYVLQSEGGWADLHRQPHHQVPLGAPECPAVTWMYVRLGKRHRTSTIHLTLKQHEAWGTDSPAQ